MECGELLVHQAIFINHTLQSNWQIGRGQGAEGAGCGGGVAGCGGDRVQRGW